MTVIVLIQKTIQSSDIKSCKRKIVNQNVINIILVNLTLLRFMSGSEPNIIHLMKKKTIKGSHNCYAYFQ